MKTSLVTAFALCVAVSAISVIATPDAAQARRHHAGAHGHSHRHVHYAGSHRRHRHHHYARRHRGFHYAKHHRGIRVGFSAHAYGSAHAGAGAGGGIASIYSLAGRKTANGERANPSGLTAAHKSLPFGTHVRVTNKRNGRSVVVRINDRGPFISGRVIDMTPAGARAIGFSGLTQVSLSVVR